MFLIFYQLDLASPFVLLAFHYYCDKIYYIKLKSRLSVRPTVTPVSQPCQHGLKRDLLEMEAKSSGTTKYTFKYLHV